MDQSAVVAFLSTMFGAATGEVYFSSLCNERNDPNEKAEYRLLTRDPDKLAAFMQKHDRKPRGMFFCVGTVNGKRSKDTIRELVCLWADIDRKGLSNYTYEQILEAITRLRLQPTAIVESGHGLHLYWIFPQAIPAQENRDRVERLLKLLCEHVAGDMQVCEISRLMRLPGSHNTKFDSYVPVAVRTLDGPRHTLESLEGWLGSAVPLTPVLQRRAGGVTAAAGASQPSENNPFIRIADEQGYKQPIDVDARLAAMRFHGAGESGVHATQLSVSAALIERGWTVDATVEYILGATQRLPGTEKWNWTREHRDLHSMCLAWIAKHPQPVEEQKATPEVMPNLGSREQTRAPAKPKSKEAHVVLAKGVLAALHERGEQLLVTPDGTYWYTDGLWALLDDREVRQRLNREITIGARSLGLVTSNRLVNEARDWILREPELIRFDTRFDAHGKVPVINGLVDPRTGTLVPPAPEHYATWRVEQIYEHNASCPIFLDMIDHVFGDREDAGRAEISQLVFELIGVGLVDKKSKALSRALLLEGGADTGKSQLLRVIGALFGKINATPFKALDGTHGLMPFQHRDPWILDEAADEGDWHRSSIVKSIISGDPIAINIKNGQIVTQPFTAPIFWGTNHLPQFKEITRAISERIVILQCRQTFNKSRPVGPAKLARERGYHEPSELVIDTELQGVLALSLAGLQRALTRGYLEIPIESLELMEELLGVSNIAMPFRADCLVYHPGKMISRADLYAAFSGHYAREYDIDRIPTQTRFGLAMKGLGDPRIVIDDKLRQAGSGRRYYGCIALSPYGLECWKQALEGDHFNLGAKKFPGASDTERVVDPSVALLPGWDVNLSVRRAKKVWDLEQTQVATTRHKMPSSDGAETSSPTNPSRKKPLGRNDPRF